MDPVGFDGYHFRDANRWWINWDECRANEYFDFYITLSDPRNRLEVWAGTDDCGNTRSALDHGQCWLVAANDAPQYNFPVSVPVRLIVSNNNGENSADLQDPDALGEEICDQSTDSDGVKLALYFFLQDGGKVVGTAQKWDPTNLGGVGYDMLGPAPPGAISIGMGESQLSVNLEQVDPTPDRERFAAYCSPIVPDENFVPEEGTDACATTELMPNARPNPNLKCGEANETSNTITTDRSLPGGKLQNDTLYAVAVAGEDLINNAGPLSPIACGTPKELDDFFELYRRANGPGGGGFCSVSPGLPRSAPGATALLGALLAAFGMRRRRSHS